jgi:hypothetical protein
MSDFRKGRIDRHRDEGIYVPPIEGDRKEKEGYRHLPSSEKKILSATFFNYLKKLFGVFSGSRELGGRIVDRMAIVDRLRALQGLLMRLMSEDLSQSVSYASEFSDLFGETLEDLAIVTIMERKELKKSSGMRELVDAIKHYPKNEEEHPLGFYLMEHAGKDWIPFPFINQLSSLYEEHQKAPDKSTLTQWDRLFDEVIENLKGLNLFKDQ